MNVNDIFPSKYLKAADLKGRDVQVIIERYAIEELGDQRKLVLYFQGKEKGLVTNRTNADRISHLYGPDTDDWIGKPIMLYEDMVSFQGRSMAALRVRPPRKGNGGAAPAPERAVPRQTPQQGDDFDEGREEIPFLSDNAPYSEQFRLAAKEWVELDSAASLLEETKSAVLSQKMAALGDMPVSRAELLVKASPEWHQHVVKMCQARSAANLLKVKVEWLRMRFQEWNSLEATKRAEMKL